MTQPEVRLELELLSDLATSTECSASCLSSGLFLSSGYTLEIATGEDRYWIYKKPRTPRIAIFLDARLGSATC